MYVKSYCTTALLLLLHSTRCHNHTTVVPEVAGGVTEDRVGDKCFELVFAFDEVITTGGYREAINLQQIKTNMVCMYVCTCVCTVD